MNGGTIYNNTNVVEVIWNLSCDKLALPETYKLNPQTLRMFFWHSGAVDTCVFHVGDRGSNLKEPHI